ncbi:hypothetical protein [Paenibacillus sp. GCM10028914]|uniref:hypothetical protein n=1 Tax=Paenibacillus sp. GCM10028914 TaxID=3273416 RepID=UPI00361AD765
MKNEAFLSEAAGATTISEWEKALKDYNVSFEQLLPNNEKKMLALKEKDSEQIELTKN